MRGASSEERTVEKAESAETIMDSGRWKAGLMEVIIEGVRRRMEGLVGGGGRPAWGCGCGWGSGRSWRSGRKDWRVMTGVRRRVLRRSERVLGERVAIGLEGYEVDGMKIKDLKVKWCNLAPWNAA